MEHAAKQLRQWRERAEAIRSSYTDSPNELAFLRTIGKQLGIATDCIACVQHRLNQVLGDSEIYTYGADAHQTYHWDIAQARAIGTRDQLAPITLDP